MSVTTSFIMRDEKQRREFKSHLALAGMEMSDGLRGLIDEFNSDPGLRLKIARRHTKEINEKHVEKHTK